MFLYRTHRNFLIALIVLLTFNIASAFTHYAAPNRYFKDNPGLDHVTYVPPVMWGTAFAVAAVLLALGIWRTSTFHIARIGLAIGLLTCTTRLILLSYHFDLTMTGLPTWYCVAGMHLSCLLEPPFNPSTTR